MILTAHQALQRCIVRKPQLCSYSGIFHYFSQHAFLDSACQSCAWGGFAFKKVLTSTISEYSQQASMYLWDWLEWGSDTAKYQVIYSNYTDKPNGKKENNQVSCVCACYARSWKCKNSGKFVQTTKPVMYKEGGTKTGQSDFRSKIGFKIQRRFSLLGNFTKILNLLTWAWHSATNLLKTLSSWQHCDRKSSVRSSFLIFQIVRSPVYRIWFHNLRLWTWTHSNFNL